MPRGSLNRVLRAQIIKYVRNFLRAAHVDVRAATQHRSGRTRFSFPVKIRTIHSGSRGQVAVSGQFSPLGSGPFDRSIRIPTGGIRSQSGKALRLEKPEGIVFRSRTYTRFSGQTIVREGFLDEVLRKFSATSSLGGSQGASFLIADFLDQLASGVIHAILDYFRRAGYRVNILR